MIDLTYWIQVNLYFHRFKKFRPISHFFSFFNSDKLSGLDLILPILFGTGLKLAEATIAEHFFFFFLRRIRALSSIKGKQLFVGFLLTQEQ